MTTRTDPGFHCASCEARIPTAPVFHLGLAFCCAGCAADGPCICSYDADPADSGDDALVEVAAA